MMGCAQEADIVFVEYTMNDWSRHKGDLSSLESDSRRGFENLLRMLLRYEKSPAIIIVHAWSPLAAGEWIGVGPEDYFHTTPEDHVDTIAKYVHSRIRAFSGLWQSL